MEAQFTFAENATEQRYELETDGCKAFIEYTLHPGVIVLTHTYVPKQFEGRGIGSQLVRSVLEDVRIKELQVVPQCDFVAQYIFRHPEWEDLVIKQVPIE